jgi:hypothetical protein
VFIGVLTTTIIAQMSTVIPAQSKADSTGKTPHRHQPAAHSVPAQAAYTGDSSVTPAPDYSMYPVGQAVHD